MTVLHISDTARNAAANAIAALANAGSGPGLLRIYTGSMPARGAAATGTKLIEITLDDPAFGSAAAGVVTLADLDPTDWIADGTASYCRIVDSDINLVAQGDVTVAAGTGFLKLSSITAVTATPLDVTALTLTMPSGE